MTVPNAEPMTDLTVVRSGGPDLRTILLIALLLFGGAFLGWRILRMEPPPVGEAEHGAEPPAAQEAAKGPHNGRLLTQGELQVEVTIFESGVPPEFRVYVSRDGKPVPLSDVDLSIRLSRLGQEAESIRFRPRGEYLLGDQEIVEPHSFDVEVSARVAGASFSGSYQQREGRVALSAEAAQAAGITGAVAGPVEMQKTLSLPGQVALDEDRVAHVVPPLAGIAGPVNVSLGDRVQRGETLLAIQATELADLEGDYQEALQEAAVARDALQRVTARHDQMVRMAEVVRRESDPDRIHRELQGLRIGEAKGELLAAVADLRSARQRVEREKLLVERQLGTRRALQEATSDFEAARARYVGRLEEAVREGELEIVERRQELEVRETSARVAAERLRARGVPAGGSSSGSYVVTAPLSGSVVEKDVAEGEFLSTTESIFRIADLSQVWVQVTVPAAQLGAVRPGQVALVETSPGQPARRGKVTYVGPVVGEGTQSAQARVVLPNPGGTLRPGLFTTVILHTESVRVPLAVKESALQTFRDWDVVFLKAGDEYEVRPLTLGARSGGWVEVLDGLSPGDAYVAKNAYILKADLEKSGASHDH